MEVIQISKRKTKIYLNLLGSIFFVIMGFALLYAGNWFTTVYGLLHILIFGFAIFKFAYYILDTNPALTFSSDGVLIHRSIFNIGIISYDDIKYIVYHKGFYSIVIINPQKYIIKENEFNQRIMNYNIKNSSALIHIPSDFLSATSYEIIDILKKFNIPVLEQSAEV